MTIGLALVVIIALVLFIAVCALTFSTGLLLDAAVGDFMAQVIVGMAFLLLWFVPSLAVFIGWWAYS